LFSNQFDKINHVKDCVLDCNRSMQFFQPFFSRDNNIESVFSNTSRHQHSSPQHPTYANDDT